MEPPIPSYETLSAPCYSMLIKHKSSGRKHKNDTLVSDLGVRRDWENLPPMVVDSIKNSRTILRVKKDVATILRENGQKLSDVGGIIWSHHHLDHIGDPSTFPSSVDLIVGPGFKDAITPGWPTLKSRKAPGKVAISARFDFAVVHGKNLKIEDFDAIDFYGDGSFYLLNTPGHAIGHLCALARDYS